MPLIQRVLHLGPLDNNSYLLVWEATRETAVVDVGFEAEVAIEAIRKHDLRVCALLNTHAHYDHVAGMRAVQEACGGEYWLHPGDVPLLDRLSEQGAALGFPPASPPEGMRPLEDGQHILIGEASIEVLHTPGHSPGGVCFRHQQSVWVGDTLFAGSVGRTDLPGGSFEALERSIRERLLVLDDPVRVFPGHGPATTIGRERRDNPFVGEAARPA